MLAACQRGQQNFLSAKFTAGCSECRDPEAGEWSRLPGPASGPGPRRVWRSVTTGPHARVRAVEDADLLPSPDQPGAGPNLGGVDVSRRRLLAPAATSARHQRHGRGRAVPVATGIIHSPSRPALLGVRPPSGASLLRKRVGWTAPCPGRSQEEHGRTNGTNVAVGAPHCSSAPLPYPQPSSAPSRVPERSVHAARMHRPKRWGQFGMLDGVQGEEAASRSADRGAAVCAYI